METKRLLCGIIIKELKDGHSFCKNGCLVDSIGLYLVANVFVGYSICVSTFAVDGLRELLDGLFV